MKNIEKVQVYLYKSGTSDVIMEYAIVPYDKTANAAYYSQVNTGLRRYRNNVE